MKIKKLLSIVLSALITMYTLCAKDMNETSPKFDSEAVPVVVIGSGPAGLTSAVWTQRSGMKTVVITGEQIGGQVSEISKIGNWPGKKEMTGLEAMEDLQKQAESFGAEIVDDIVTSVDFTQRPFVIETADGKTIKSLAVIVATGAKPIKPDLPGVKKYWAKGIGICSICDAPFTKGQNVIVVGGNDYGAERTLQLAAYADKVTLVEKNDRLSANAKAQEQMAQKDNIEIKLNTTVKGFNGDDKSVTEVTLETNGKTETMPIHAAFLSAGTKPNSGLFKDKLRRDKDGYLIVQNCTQHTSKKGVFAAGMIEDSRYGKAGNAIGRGVQAALDTVHYLQNELGYNPEITTSPKSEQYMTKSSSAITTITSKAEFEKMLQTSDKPVFLYAYSPTCLHCTKMAGRIKAVAEDLQDTVKVIKIDVSKLQDLVEALHIHGVPQVMVFKGEHVIGYERGKMTEDQLRSFIQKSLKSENSKKPQKGES